MSEKKFQFVSPGVFVEEIDKSFLEEETTARGPLIVGRADRGPTMAPVRVESFADFAQTFGTPIPGGRGGDVWRDGNYTSPTYASYAAQAYLRNNAPITFVRLVGSKNVSGDALNGTPGYTTPDYASASCGGGAQGLFVFTSGSATTICSGTLAAVWYLNHQSSSIELVGLPRGGSTEVQGTGILIEGVGDANEVAFKARIRADEDTVGVTQTFDFDPSSNRFVRKVFNTNPTLANTVNNTADDQQLY